MRLGISSWSLPWSVGVRGYPPPRSPVDVFALVAKAADKGVEVVQIADNLPLDALDGAELARLRREAESRNVTLEVGTWGLEAGKLGRYIEIAERLESKVLRTVLRGSMSGPAELASAEMAIKRVVPALEAAGVTLAVENNETFAAAEYALLVERAGSPHVGICLDTANSLGRPEPLTTVVERLAPYTMVVHAKDYTIQRVGTRMGFSVIGRPAGSGRVDFDLVLGSLRRQGRDQISVIIEHWPPFQTDIEDTIRLEEQWLEESIDFLSHRV